MINNFLLQINLALLVLAFIGFWLYKFRYKQSYWRVFFSGRPHTQTISLIYAPLSSLSLSTENKKLLSQAKGLGAEKFVSFFISSLNNSHLTIASYPQQAVWISIFFIEGKNYTTITAISKHKKKQIITITNAPRLFKTKGAFIRVNHPEYSVAQLLTHLQTILPVEERHAINLKSYLKISKTMFLKEIISYDSITSQSVENTTVQN